MKKLFMLALLLGFSFTLAACNGEEEDDDEALLEEAAETLAIYSTDINDIRGNFRVPTQGRNDVSISWDVSPSDILELGETYEGDMDEQLIRVNRPDYEDGNVDVTLTATLSLGDYETTVDFEGLVRAMDEGTAVYDSFADLYENAETGDTVVVTGTVVHKVGGGYFLWDGEQGFSVYGGGDVELGDEVEVMGEYDSYHTLYQIGGPDNEDVISSGNEYSVDAMGIEESSVEEFMNIDSSDKGIHGMPHRVEGMIVEGDLADTGYTNYYIQDIDDPDNFILMYHAQNEGALDWLGENLGEYVSLTVSLYADHASNGKLGFFDENNFEHEILDVDVDAMLNIGIQEVEDMSFITAGDDVEFPTELESGHTFSNWTSGNVDILNDDGEVVDRPEESTTVTFTADAEYEFDGEMATGEAEVDVVVVGTETTNVDETLNLDDGEHVHTEGIVTGFSYSQLGFFMQDEDGTPIFVRGFDRDADWIEELEVGNKVTVFGTLDRYSQHGNNQRQITDDKLLTSNDEGDHDLYYETDYSMEDIVDAFVPYDDDEEEGLRGGYISNRLFTVEDVSFDFEDFGDANYQIGDDDEEGNIIFDIDQLEDDFDIDYDLDMEFESLSFIVQDIHFGNHRVVVTDYELAE